MTTFATLKVAKCSFARSCYFLILTIPEAGVRKIAQIEAINSSVKCSDLGHPTSNVKTSVQELRDCRNDFLDSK